MNMEKRKLTNYELADIWGQVDCLANQIKTNVGYGRKLSELNVSIDKLLDLQKKLQWHNVALTIEKGEKNDY